MIKNRGLSLVEIMVGLAILLVAMVPIWGLMGSSHQQVMRSADEIKASELAIELLEQLQNIGNVDCLPNDGEESKYTLNSGGAVPLDEDGAVSLKVGTFEEYFMPKLFISSSNVYDGFTGERVIGRVVSLCIQYKSKEGRALEYVLRGFVSAKKQ